MEYTKIVLNQRPDNGDFGLSEKAMVRYAELTGQTVYPAYAYWSASTILYWTIPYDQQPADILKLTTADRNNLIRNHTISNSHFDRADPVLVQVVEELGAEAGHQYAHLKIEILPKGTHYKIETSENGYETIVLRWKMEDWLIA